MKASAKLLTDPAFGGEPKVLSPDVRTRAEGQSELVEPFETSSGHIKCSAAFYGLRIYIVRLLEPIWKEHLFRESTKGKLLQCTWSPEEIEVSVDQVLHSVAPYVGGNKHFTCG